MEKNNKQTNCQCNVLVCSCCGGYFDKNIKDKRNNIDHIIPRAIYKWTEHMLSQEEYKILHKDIESQTNKVPCHTSCNIDKSETLPDIDNLFISNRKKTKLKALLNKHAAEIDMYEKLKSEIIEECDGCFFCHCRDNLSIRRKNILGDRTKENAIAVCIKCQYSANLMHKKQKKEKRKITETK